MALYVHSSSQASPFNPATEFEESMWVTVNLADGDSLVIGCVYKSDSGSDENNSRLIDLFKEINDSQ